MPTNSIDKHFLPKNNFIPGTNIIKGSENRMELKSYNTENENLTTSSDVFLDDFEGDELLANLDF